MEDDACREDIAYGLTFRTHVSDVDYFGSDKARSAAADKEILFLVCVGGQAEIANSDFPTFVPFEHDVFRLEVPVDDAAAVEVHQPVEQTLNYLLYVFSLQSNSALPNNSFTLMSSLSCIPYKYYRIT